MLDKLSQINILRMAIFEFKLEGKISDYTLSALIYTEDKDIIALISDEKNFIENGEKLLKELMHEEYYTILRNQKGM